MDALRLRYTAKDQLHPLLSDVITAVNNVAGAKEFEGRQSIVQWLIILNQMGAGDEITEAQGRQVCYYPSGARKGLGLLTEGRCYSILKMPIVSFIRIYSRPTERTKG